jgi:hypothetical protein
MPPDVVCEQSAGPALLQRLNDEAEKLSDKTSRFT